MRSCTNSVTWVRISMPIMMEVGMRGDRATSRPPNPQPMSAISTGCVRGVASGGVRGVASANDDDGAGDGEGSLRGSALSVTGEAASEETKAG